MQEADILSWGVPTDKTYQAYKSIDVVMAAQKELVQPYAEMRPKVVVMGGERYSDDGE